MILAIDTSTLQFGLALMKEEGPVLAEYSMSKGKGHFGCLMPCLHFLLTSSESSLQDIRGLAVALGPGSFTGLRVGLSLAKGICHALEVPIVGISSLEALASQVCYADMPVAPVLDSRRGELFTARFGRSREEHFSRKSEDVSLRLKDFPSLFKEPTLFIGNDFTSQVPLIKETLGHRARVAPAHLWCLRASSIGHLSLRRFRARDLDDPGSLSPIYLRPPDIRTNPFPVLNPTST